MAAAAADITALFKASVKTVKTRNKALGVPPGGAEPAALWPRRDPRARGGFSARAREVVNNIGKLKDFLLQHRKDYINAYSHLMSEYVRMSDTDRDQIDQDAQIFMRTCADAIQQLRAEAHKDIHSPQVKQHRETVLDFIADYLKRVCKLYSEQRAIRVKRVVDKKRLSRLEPEQSRKSPGRAPEKEAEAETPPEELEEKLPREGSQERNLVDEHAGFGLGQDSRGEDELSPEEIQMFEQENQRLVGEMNSLFDEVRQIEGKVVEISRLQEIFTEKVLQQETEIDNIHQIVVGATENIKEGNEDIREAIKNNAGFRVWILFFLVMCSFSLLFLDWYGS
ncbi:syntaxin-18 [Pseudonaja textilis]|uniref:Syntaxin-18 n=1 Tax=Pseudonaja textilis TaxID=8673 RepID=A0A670YH75_PSETE|nr:syntaxin-18 [Pseudonaja textilis]